MTRSNRPGAAETGTPNRGRRAAIQRKAPAHAQAPAARRRDMQVILGLTLLAFLLRLANTLAQRANPFTAALPVDQRAYDLWAQSIASGEWLGRAVFYQDPLYPYALALFYATIGRHLTLLGIAQGLLGALNIPLLWGIAARTWGRRAAVVTAALAALYAPFIFYDALVLKTFLEVLCLNAALLALMRALECAAAERGAAAGKSSGPWRSSGLPRSPAAWGLFAGLALGLGTLARANYLALVPLLLLWLFLPRLRDPAVSASRRALRPVSIALLIGLAVILLPVLARNRVVGHDWVLTTAQAGQNFYIGNNPANARGVYQAPAFVRPEPAHEEEDFRREAEQRIGHPLKPSEVSRYWMHEGLAYVERAPGHFLALSIKRLGLLLHRHEIPDNEDFRFWARYSPWLRFNPVRFDLAGPLAIAGLLLGWRHRRRLSILYLVLGGYLLSVACFFVLGRYRLPAASLLLIFAAGAVADALEAWRARERRRLGLAALGLVLGLGLVHRHSSEEEGMMSASLYTNLGAAYTREGRAADALAAQRKAVELAPQWDEARYNLGIALYASGDREGALREFREVVRLNPNYAEAWSYLGNILVEKGDVATALEAHRRARSLQTDRGIHLFNLARILAQAGRADEAAAELDTLDTVRDPQYTAEGMTIRAGILAARGDPRGAASLLREYLRLRPQSPIRPQVEQALHQWEASGAIPR